MQRSLHRQQIFLGSDQRSLRQKRNIFMKFTSVAYANNEQTLQHHRQLIDNKQIIDTRSYPNSTNTIIQKPQTTKN